MLGFVSRSQLQEIHELKSDRNALKVLNSLKEWVHVKPNPNRFNENVYYLNKAGCEVMGELEERRWVQSVEHYILRNDLYIFFQKPKPFHIEPDIPLGGIGSTHSVRPDAYFIRDNVHHFLEVDRTQKMLENRKKIELYAKLSPYMYTKYEKHPRIVFYTFSSIRQEKLTAWCKELEVRCSVYTTADLQ